MGQVLRPIDAIDHTYAVFFKFFHRKLVKKRLWVDAKTLVFNRGMTYQTKEKGIIKVSI
jgi:hypothetical protein